MMARAAALLLALAGTAPAQSPAEATPISPAMDPPRLRLQNDTPHIVNDVFLPAAPSSRCGHDQLGANETLAAGGGRVFTLAAGRCLFDLRVVYAGGMTEQRRRLDLCGAPTITLPLAANRSTR